MRAVVVGGGAAGLSAALAIQQAGWRCVVLETRDRAERSPRDAHVHRLSTVGASALAALAPEIMGAFGATPPLVTLDEVESRLAHAAEAAGVDIRFGAAELEIAPESPRWCVQSSSSSSSSDGAHAADLLVDATGGRRAVLTLLDTLLPDIVMDDLGGAESFISWNGRSEDGPESLTPWADPTRELDGLMQIGPSGRATLTCRYAAGRPAPSLSEAIAAAEVAHPAVAERVRNLGLQVRGVRYTAPGVQRIALEEADLSGLPPLALVGDALILAPPRFGEGLQRAFEHALFVRDALLAGDAAILGARLAEDARQAWAENGLAMACRAWS